MVSRRGIFRIKEESSICLKGKVTTHTIFDIDALSIVMNRGGDFSWKGTDVVVMFEVDLSSSGENVQFWFSKTFFLDVKY